MSQVILWDCCNPECGGQSKKFRCGNCRHYGRLFCAACGESVDNPKKIYCVECALENRRTWSKEYHIAYGRRIDKVLKSTYNRRNYLKRKALNRSKGTN